MSENCCCPPVPPPFSCPPMGFGNVGCPTVSNGECFKRGRKTKTHEKRWPQCNFLKPCIDLRIYRREEWLNEFYAGHVPKDYYRPRCDCCSKY